MDKKQSAKELERRRPTFMKLGLIVGMAMALMAFEYTTYGPDLKHYGDLPEIDIDRELPPTVKLRKKVEPKVEMQKDPNRFEVHKKPIPEPTPDPEPVKPDPEPELFSLDTMDPDEGSEGEGLPVEPFIVVEEMPHFKTCATASEDERRSCTQREFIEHLNGNIKVPRDLYFSEKAYVSFVVNSKGKVSDVTIKNEVSKGLEKEIERVFALYPELVPGKQRGKNVPVIYTIPVSIRIN